MAPNAHVMHDERLRQVGDIAHGVVVKAERALSRREGWLVDVEGADGVIRPLFVRVARDGDPMNSLETLEKEAHLAGELVRAGIRVARLVGVRPDLRVAVYERLPGRSEMTSIDPEQQQRVYARFLEELARVHALDIDELPLDWVRPSTPRACAEAGLDALHANYVARLSAPDATATISPLAVYGLRWLRERAPDRLDRLVLVHGDAGTPNFMFEGDDVTGLIDWEWARFGDPMEDLGNAALHATFHPSGDWPALLEHYERSSGVKVDVDRVAYWRAHLAVRSVVALHTATAIWDAHDPVALNLCYRIVSDRICCECIAEHDGVSLERPALRWARDERPSLHDAVADVLDEVILPPLEGAFVRGRVHEAALLVRSLEREHAARPLLDAIDLEELHALLGVQHTSVATGLADLAARIADGMPDDDGRVLRYLARRAWREEQLYAPVVSLFPDLALRPLRR
jgi:aminoglycoside phosphotransferase (APT) family kinase protein